MRKKLMIALLALLFTAPGVAKTIEIIEKFDVHFYHPEKFGLKDLVFEARIDGLLEKLNKKKSYGKLADIYFKIYWIYPGQYKIIVNGLPRGFSQLKTGLKELIKNRLDFVIPKMLSTRMRGYKLVRNKINNDIVITAKGSVPGREVNEMKMSFAVSGKLLSLEESGLRGVNTSKMEMGVRSWSHNKWVLKKLIVKQLQGLRESDVEYDFEYLTEKGIGFPGLIKIRSEINNDARNKKNRYKEVGGIRFINYEVNTGKAEKFILKNL